MKKIIYLAVLVLTSFLAKAQYPVNQSLGSDSTIVTVKGAIKGRVVLNSFTDTAQANLQRIKSYPVALIFTTSDSSLWIRSVGGTKWDRVYTSGGSTTNPNLQNVTDVNNETTNNLIVNSGFGSKTYQSGSAFVIEQIAANKSISINTTTLTSDRTATLQDTSGTIAYLHDITGGSGWGLSGNTITAGQYLGTNNAEDLVLKTIGSEIARFSGDGTYRISMGNATIASGDYSTAMGDNTAASGNYSTAMGENTAASGYISTAMGYNTTASGYISTTMGNATIASGDYSTAMGNGTTASGDYSTAMGGGTTASGDYSTAMGGGTKSKSYVGTVIGSYNDSTDAVSASVFDPLNRAFQIGIGTADNARSNAMTVLFNGNTGIGTTTPSYKLDVTGKGKFTDNVKFADGTAAAPSITASSNTNTGISFYNGSGSAGDQLKISANTLGAVMSVQNNNGSGFSGIEYLDNAGSLKTFTGYENAGANFRFNHIGSGGIDFKISSVNKLSINNSGSITMGNYGAGTTIFDASGNITSNTETGTGNSVRANSPALTTPSFTGVPTGTITSGTYTPTLTGIANVAASTAYSCQYNRVGNTVTVSGEVDIDPTTTLTLTQLGVSLPIASALTASNELAGTSSDELNTSARVAGDATNDRAEIRLTPADVTNRRFSFTFTYRVL